MPYIKEENRIQLKTPTAWNAGELNFCLTEIVIQYLDFNGLSYKTCNDIVGALDNCKDEFKRRVQDPYEDRKIKENGDVYPEKYLKGGK